MDGKELLRLLDFIKHLQVEGDDSEKSAKDADEESKIVLLKEKANFYKEVAKELEEILRDLNRYN